MRSLVANGDRVEAVSSERDFLRLLPEATHAMVWKFKTEWFKKAGKLRVLSTPAAGKELLPESAPAGVTMHFGGFHGKIIAESVVGFMLAWAHGFFAIERHKPHWARSWLSDKCYSLAGTKAVIVGFGRIGHAIKKTLDGFGVETEGFTRKNIGELPKAAKEADWFILALPSNSGTDNLLDAKKLSWLPKRCVVINVGRGNSIDEAALLAALKGHKIAGAYLDVCKGESSEIWQGHRRGRNEGGINPNKTALPNLVLMPHSSAFSPRYVREMFTELANEGLI